MGKPKQKTRAPFHAQLPRRPCRGSRCPGRCRRCWRGWSSCPRRRCCMDCCGGGRRGWPRRWAARSTPCTACGACTPSARWPAGGTALGRGGGGGDTVPCQPSMGNPCRRITISGAGYSCGGKNCKFVQAFRLHSWTIFVVCMSLLGTLVSALYFALKYDAVCTHHILFVTFIFSIHCQIYI